MPRKGENIYKRKDGRWEGRYIKGRVEGKAVYGYVYSKSYSALRKELTLKRNECIQKADKSSTPGMLDAPFSDLSEMWMRTIRSYVKESTWGKYRNLLNCVLVPSLENAKVSEINYAVALELCNELLDNGGKNEQGLGTKTVVDALSLLKQILKYASRMNYQIDRTALDVSLKPKPSPPRVLSIQEERILISALSKEMTLTDLGIFISLFTGIRIGELCALTWEDISLESNMIHIHRTMQRIQTSEGSKKTAILVAEPKSRCSVREIPIASLLREELCKQPVKEGYVLTGRKDQYIEPRTMQNRFKATLEKCNIQNTHFHTLRHSFATRCIEVGFDVKSLSEILGHANVSITMNLYVHPSQEIKQKNMDKLSDLFSVR